MAGLSNVKSSNIRKKKKNGPKVDERAQRSKGGAGGLRVELRQITLRVAEVGNAKKRGRQEGLQGENRGVGTSPKKRMQRGGGGIGGRANGKSRRYETGKALRKGLVKARLPEKENPKTK